MNKTAYFAEIVYPVYPDFGIPISVKEDAIPKLILAELSRCLPAHTLLHFFINSQTLELKLKFPITLSEEETSTNIATRIASDIQMFVENIRRIVPIGSFSHFALKLIASEPLAETTNDIKDDELAFTIPDTIPTIGRHQLESVLQKIGCKRSGAMLVALSRAGILVESDANPAGEISPQLTELVLQSSDVSDFHTSIVYLSEKNPELKLKYPRQFGSTMFGQLKTALQTILREVKNKPQESGQIKAKNVFKFENDTELPPIASDELRNELEKIDSNGFKKTISALAGNGRIANGFLDLEVVAALIKYDTYADFRRNAAIQSIGPTRFSHLKQAIEEIILAR